MGIKLVLTEAHSSCSTHWKKKIGDIKLITEIQKQIECREKNCCHKLLKNWSEDTKAKWFCFLKFKCSVKCNCYSKKLYYMLIFLYLVIYLFIFYVLLSHVCFCSGQFVSFSFYAFLATSPRREILILKEFLFK